MNEIIVLLKDNKKHNQYNKQLISFLNEYHESLNDNKYLINIKIVDDNNIDKYIKSGIESIPAINIDNEFIYGVNQIIQKLSILLNNKNTNEVNNIDTINNTSIETNYYKMALNEMNDYKNEDDDENESTKGNLYTGSKYQNKEIPMNENDIANALSKMDSIYSNRGKLPNKKTKNKTKDKILNINKSHNIKSLQSDNESWENRKFVNKNLDNKEMDFLNKIIKKK
jgi:hypothetical protein